MHDQSGGQRVWIDVDAGSGSTNICATATIIIITSRVGRSDTLLRPIPLPTMSNINAARASVGRLHKRSGDRELIVGRIHLKDAAAGARPPSSHTDVGVYDWRAGVVPWLVVVVDALDQLPLNDDDAFARAKKWYVDAAGVDDEFYAAGLDMALTVCTRPRQYPMLQLCGEGFVAYVLVGGPGWRDQLGEQPVDACFHTTTEQAAVHVLEAAMMGCAPRSARALFWRNGCDMWPSHLLDCGGLDDESKSGNGDDVDLAAVFSAAAKMGATADTAAIDCHCMTSHLAMVLATIVPHGPHRSLIDTQLPRMGDAILRATAVRIPEPALRTILKLSENVLLECERWRAKKLHSLAVAMRMRGIKLPPDVTADERVCRAKWSHNMEMACQLRFPRDLRWLVRMTGSMAFKIPTPLGSAYRRPWQWRIDVPRPIQLDTVSQIASQRWGPRNLVDKLVEAGMQRGHAIAAVYDAHAIGNPTQGSLSLGGSWLTTDGDALVVLNGPYADTVWLRDINDDEDALWPVGLANDSMEEHGDRLPSAEGTHSLLSYVEATFPPPPTTSGEASAKHQCGTKEEEDVGEDHSGNGNDTGDG